MNDIKDQFKPLKHDLALTSEERSRMRALLVSKMETAPEMSPFTEPSIRSPYSFIFTRPQAFVAAFLAVIVIGTGTASAAANSALPGDVLYPVKVSVNERVERAIAFSPSAKANVEIEHAEERLHEVMLLAARGDEDVRAVEDIAEAVEEYAERASKAAEELAEEGDAEEADKIEQRISAALLAHADILEAQAEQYDDGDRQRLRALSVALSVSLHDENARKGHGGDDFSRLSVSREESVRERIEELRKDLDDKKVSVEISEELERELAAIEAEFGTARTLSAEEAYDEASRIYEEIERRAYLADALLTSARRISDSTGKEVYISFDGGGKKGKAKEEVDMDAAATMMFMSAPSEEEDNRGGDDDDDEDEDEDEEDDDDRSGRGGGESRLEFRIEDNDD